MLRCLSASALLLGLSAPLLAQVCPPNLPPRVAPDSRYSLSEPVVGQVVVTDLHTGLQWKQCPEGRSGATCSSGSATSTNLTGALAAANASTFAGHNDWRLPSAIELYSLVETSCHSPSMNTWAFPNTGSGLYWSSSTRAPTEELGWAVAFNIGNLFSGGKASNPHAIRLVRGGQRLDGFDATGDFTPAGYSFAAQTDVPLSDLRLSNSIIVSGIDTPVGIGVSGASDSAYSINSGPFGSAPGVVVNGDSVVVRHTSAATSLASVTTTLRIGALTADFVSTTADFDYTVTPSASTGGSIDPSTPQTVLQGQTASFTLAADAGSYLSTVTGSCDGTLTDNSYTTEPVIADCSVQAQFVPQNASTVELQASPNPARANQMVTFTTTVSGGDFGPVDGQVLASASSGESCIDVSPQVNGSESSFSCNIAFATLGPRTISASFSASATHLNGSSGPLEIRVVRLTDLSVSIDPGQTSVEPDAAVSYLVEVRNTGPDTAPASMVVLASDPPLVAASWDCTALGGASCPQNSGVGEFAGMPSLPVGGGLNVLQIGIAPTSLPEGLTVQASISANDQAPHHALDPDQSNNLAIDFSQSARVFADGFE